MPSGTLQKTIADYADLDRQVGRLISHRLRHVCADCRKQCCRPDVCRQAVESWWLRQASQLVHGKWWPADWRTRDTCIAMTAGGCLLEAGRPTFCRSFVCDRYVEEYRDVWEVVFYSFLSDLTGQTVRLSSRADVEYLPAGEVRRHAKAIARRVADSRSLLEQAKRLIDPAVAELAKHRIALKLLASQPAFLRATTRRMLLARLGGPPSGR
jgi:hypothetical protein